MAFRFELIHHPGASEDYLEARAFFTEIDPGLAKLFDDDFRGALAGLASGRLATHLYSANSTLRWVKLRRFSHKIFFDPKDDETRFVLAIVSGKRHPSRLLRMLRKRGRA
jgi:plasmid stabilization system protein ParE